LGGQLLLKTPEGSRFICDWEVFHQNESVFFSIENGALHKKYALKI